MAEPDKDLPLVVAEILIEMHGINDRLKGVGSRLDAIDNRLGKAEDILLQAVDNIQQISKAVNRTAEVLLQQQQEFNRRFDQQQRESDRRFELLLEADRQQATRLERAIASLDNRLERLENN